MLVTNVLLTVHSYWHDFFIIHINTNLRNIA